MLFKDGVARADESSWRPPDGQPHFTPKAKSVIWIFLCGGVSHVESFDVKPELNKYAGKSIAETPYADVLKTEGKDVIGANPSHGNRKVIMPLQTGYKQYGESGLVVGDWFKNVGECADDLAVVRSLWTDSQRSRRATHLADRPPSARAGTSDHRLVGQLRSRDAERKSARVCRARRADGRLLRRSVYPRRGVSRAGVRRRAPERRCEEAAPVHQAARGDDARGTGGEFEPCSAN